MFQPLSDFINIALMRSKQQANRIMDDLTSYVELVHLAHACRKRQKARISGYSRKPRQSRGHISPTWLA